MPGEERAFNLTSTLATSTYRVTFTARQRLNLPEYLGSTLRGAFGHAFRAVACQARMGEPCVDPQTCAYHLTFESTPPPGSEALSRHEEIPRPFVIAPEWRLGPEGYRCDYEPGQEISFGLTLVGRAQEFFPHFVLAFREMGSIGRSRQAVALAQIETSCHIVYDARDNLVRGRAEPVTLADCAREPCLESPVTIEFLTPTRLKHEGRWVQVPEFHIVFRRLLGRLSSMARFHCGGPLEVDFKGLIEAAQKIRLARDDTKRTSWSRYSNRQNTDMRWGGLVGSVTYEGNLESFWPYLAFGQRVHVGHGATFGLGRYRIAV